MVSFIIPAYNAENYIKRSVNSIVENSPKDFSYEVLIIENGSTDQTTAIAEELQEAYSFVRLYHSEKGVSNARNLGIECAKGDWIAFVDADDCIMKEGLEAIARIVVEESFDLYLFCSNIGQVNNQLTDKKDLYKGLDAVEDCRERIISNPTRYMQVWSKLFKKELIEEYGLRFDVDITLSEDSDFVLKYTKYVHSIVICPETLYQYSINNVSTIRGNCEDKLKRYQEALEKTEISIGDESKRIQHAFAKYILMNFNVAMVRDIYCKESSLTKAEKKRQIKTASKEVVFANAINEMSLKECLTPRMVPFLAIKLRIYFVASWVYQIRAKQNQNKEQK